MSIYIGKSTGKNSHLRTRISALNEKCEIRVAKSARGFSLTEILLTMSLFLLLAGIGIGAYFQYYQAALVNTDIDSTLTIMKDTRFKALKNPTNDDYGVRVDTATNSIISFRDTYTPGSTENVIMELKQLTVQTLNLDPNIGVTNEILFEKKTGKTQNTGTFTIGNLNRSHTFNINAQGVIN